MHSTIQAASEQVELNGNVREADTVPYLINQREDRDFVMLNVDVPIYNHLKNDMESLFQSAEMACTRAEEATLQIEETALLHEDTSSKNNMITIDQSLFRRCDKAMKLLQNSLNELKVIHKAFIDVKQKAKANTEAVRMELTESLASENTIHENEDLQNSEIFTDLNKVSIRNPVKCFTETVEDRLHDWRTKRPMEKYSDNNAENYKRFKQAVWLIRYPEDDLPTKWWYRESQPFTQVSTEDTTGLNNRSISRAVAIKSEACNKYIQTNNNENRNLANEDEETEDEDDQEDDDIETAGAKISLYCPISKALLINPVTSTVCGHSYSKQNINDLCAQDQTRGSFRCPVGGCDRVLTKRQLVPNETLATRVKYYEINSRKIAQREKRTISSLEIV
ncbi:hypothetical protein NADFUDRAFT_66707 [Nadsonia fulvescens var. elongata DSM 6958]|uniref:SP-RING-type domain-containing protein n=1 Tax=Nadsonia fulvescens var. elongata DSM 6958 TaxID=857566 RepID=A0A1E3PI51_9ASCO|nr:hypothetical protein NADFUDRAFT_66707 [Nadsonia fulvescens var. elongata DSM 6958]